jgi:MATE family multidrug resistance protein
MLDYRYRTILTVALPLMLSSFIQSIVLITDAAFISRYDVNAFDAVGNGGLIYITFFMCLYGMSDGAQILIARRIGEKRTEAISGIFTSSLLVHTMIALLMVGVINLIVPSVLKGVTRNPELAVMELDFLRIRGYALFFAMVSLSFQAYFLAQGKTWVVLVSALITASLNIVLDYAFIFGELGSTEMGLKGAALASTMADGAGMLFLTSYVLLSGEHNRYKLFQFSSLAWKSIMEVLRVGTPLLFQGFTALATWTLFFTWIEQIGDFELTVSQNIRSVYFLAFVPIWGFAATTKTYISQFIGNSDFESISVIQRRILFLTIGFLLLSFHGAICYPETIIRIINPSEVYIHKTAEILQLVAISVLIFGFSSVYLQTINGSGNTRVTFIIEIVCMTVYLIFAYAMIKFWQVDIFWVWTSEYVYFCSMGLLSITYLRFSNWKEKKI